MFSYVARRVVQSVLVLAALSLILFTLFKVEAVGPCTALLLNPTPAAQFSYQHCIIFHALDKPLPVQYIRWVSLSLHGDFGLDVNGFPILPSILQHVPATLVLVGFAFLLQELVGLPLGIVSALGQRRLLDHGLTMVALVGLSVPTFWLSTLLILIIADRLGWVPPGGIVSGLSPNPVVEAIPDWGSAAYWSYLLAHPWPVATDLFAHLILPALTLAIAGMAADSRIMRASMIKALNADFVRTARAKGLPGHRVVLKHALRNALLPVVTNLGLFVPTLVSGAIVVETIFGWPGVGRYFISALSSNDTNTALAFLMLAGLLTLAVNLAVDVAYVVVDPRIRYE